ncbi:Uncharacterised protein [Staphylococcus aureus]|nr:Uncharacterised protein [Staphylococcus aureus]
MSPRATIKPSDTSRISSILSIPSWFSILGNTEMLAFCSSKISRISKTSLGRRTKLAAMKSTFSLIPKRISSASFSVIPGKLTLTPGKLTPFLFLSSPEFKISHLTSFLA